MTGSIARVAVLTAVVACARSIGPGAQVALRAACETSPDAKATTSMYWDGATCKPRPTDATKVTALQERIAAQDVETAGTLLDEMQRATPLDHETNIALWEMRGIAAAFVNDSTAAATAFDMLLALDPNHVLSYRLASKVTLVFEQVRDRNKTTGSAAIDVNWSHGQKVGEPVAVDVDVIADPKKFLRRATLFVRGRGDPQWHAADLTLNGHEARVVLPPIVATRPTSLELYMRAYDDHGNEVLSWAGPGHPREIPLRYDPPAPWYRKGWVIAAGLGVIGLGTGVTVYALTSSPPDKVGGAGVVK